MAKHNETGVKGERIALQYLTGKGYTILHTNWRSHHQEVDIIARKEEELVFIEIKTRRGLRYGFPEESVTRGKQEFLKAAADTYLEAEPHAGAVRFDVISILLNGDQVQELLHLEDAF